MVKTTPSSNKLTRPGSIVCLFSDASYYCEEVKANMSGSCWKWSISISFKFIHASIPSPNLLSFRIPNSKVNCTALIHAGFPQPKFSFIQAHLASACELICIYFPLVQFFIELFVGISYHWKHIITVYCICAIWIGFPLSIPQQPHNVSSL